MPGPSDARKVEFNGWSGLNNVLSEVGLPKEFLRQATNVDIDNQGKPQRRDGYTQISSVQTRSLWSGRLFPYMLYASNGQIYATNSPPTAAAVAAVNTDGIVSYCEVNGNVFFTDGSKLGLLTADLVEHPAFTSNPYAQPMCVASANGGLYAGNYQVAITFVDILGRESGTTIANQVQVAEGGGINLAFTTIYPADAVTMRVYRTDANDDVLRLVRQVPAATPVMSLGMDERVQQLMTQFLEPMQGGDIVRYLNGRLFVSLYDTIYFSEALRYGQALPQGAYLKVKGQVRMMEAVGEAQKGAGLYVSDDARTYFLSGPEPAQFEQIVAYPYPAVAGTAVVVPGSYLGLDVTTNVVYWLASNGVFCVGQPGGQVVPMSEKYALATQAQSGVSFTRDLAGIRQIVTNTNGLGGPQLAAATDRAVAQVMRNGVVVQ